MEIAVVEASSAMRRVLQLAKRAAEAESPVLLTGETGTGKELLARFIHLHSARNKGPFVQINCAALPENLLESELFGYEKGAFTGAVQRKRGRFEVAEGGTLFLDEVDELKPDLQAKLLRAVEYGEVTRLGGTEAIRVDVRIIAATNRDLHKAMRTGHFRPDLFFRLNGFPIHLPPLRERPEDILPLAHHFLQRFNSQYRTAVGLSSGAKELLLTHDWPGNVRELEKLIERLVVIRKKGLVSAAELKAVMTHGPGLQSDALPTWAEAKAAFERDLLRRAIWVTGGNRREMARRLGLARSTLRDLLRRHGLDRLLKGGGQPPLSRKA